MATYGSIDLTSDGITKEVYHAHPTFKVTWSLSNTLKFNLKFSELDSGTFGEEHKPHTGYYITDKNGEEIKFVDIDSFQRNDTVKVSSHTFDAITLKKEYFPIKLCILCDLCNNLNGTLDKTDYMHDASEVDMVWTINDKRHTHDSEPTAPSKNSETTKSITLNVSGWEKIKCDSGSWNTISGDTYTFSKLTPNTKYKFTVQKSCADCPDSVVYSKEIEISTKQRFSIGTTTIDKSATTIRVKQQWTDNGSTGISCTVKCNGVSKSITSSGGYAVFTGLTKGQEYTVEYTVTDDESNSSNGSSDVTTKLASFGTINRTTRSIEFLSYSNYSSDTMNQKLGSGSWYNINQNTLNKHDLLTHNTNYTIYCEIKDCFAYNADGTASSINDSTISNVVKTKKLGINGFVSSQRQHEIVTVWEAYIDDIICTSYYDDYKLLTFSLASKAIKGTGTGAYDEYNDYYQIPKDSNGNNVTEINDGNNWKEESSSQIQNHSDNLTWYFCKYKITGSYTDGHNTVSKELITNTTFPYSWIYKDRSWQRIRPYVYTTNPITNNIGWTPAVGFIHNGTTWKESNGE